MSPWPNAFIPYIYHQSPHPLATNPLHQTHPHFTLSNRKTALDYENKHCDLKNLGFGWLVVAMRLKEEAMVCRNEEEREEEVEEKLAQAAQIHHHNQQQLRWCTVGAGLPQQLKKVVVVGYALTSKKTKSFLQPKLERLAW